MDFNFDSLAEKLNLEKWPAVYLFKFIVPNDERKVAIVTSLFNEGTELRYDNSKTGKYVCISAKELMLDVSSIIEKYKMASQVDGVIAL